MRLHGVSDRMCVCVHVQNVSKMEISSKLALIESRYSESPTTKAIWFFSE